MVCGYIKLKNSIITVAIFLIWVTLSAFTVLPQNDFRLEITAGDKTYIYTYPEIDIYGDKPYLKNKDEIIERIYLDTVVRATDAEIIFRPNYKEKFVILTEQPGREINREKLSGDIASALENGSGKITAKFNELPASVTAEQLKQCTALRAEFSTDYSQSSDGRKHNVELAANFINGITVKPQEEFSFNKTVGERIYERGFVDAKIITEGKFVNGVGGGVCQVSTTLYNCVLLSALPVTERHSHSLSVSYIEPSFDAMVNSGVFDFKFKNDTNFPVFIKADADGQKLKIQIFGIKNEYTIKRVSTTVTSASVGYDVIPDPTGELCGDLDEKIIVPERCTISSYGELKVYKNGLLISVTKLSYDRYGGVKGVIAKKEITEIYENEA